MQAISIPAKYRQADKPEWLQVQWATYIREQLEMRRLRRCEFASLIGLDRSYGGFLFSGYIPRRVIVQRIGMLFGDVDGAYRAAGLLDQPQQELSSKAHRLMQMLCQMDTAAQDEVADLLLRLMRGARAC